MDTFVFILVGVIALILCVMCVNIYNALVRLKNQVERAWSNIDVILKQRYDEIPNLVEVAKGFAQYEKSLLHSVTEARSRYGQANTVGEKIQASSELSSALRGMIAVVESYPELKANHHFMQLQVRITQLETTIADRRETYNDAVATFNTRIEQIPDVLFAKLMKFQRQEHFKIPEADRVIPSMRMVS